jgi:hypothetical protein
MTIWLSGNHSEPSTFADLLDQIRKEVAGSGARYEMVRDAAAFALQALDNDAASGLLSRVDELTHLRDLAEPHVRRRQRQRSKRCLKEAKSFRQLGNASAKSLPG